MGKKVDIDKFLELLDRNVFLQIHNLVHKAYIDKGTEYETRFPLYFKTFEENSKLKLLFNDQSGRVRFELVKIQINNHKGNGITYFIPQVVVPFTDGSKNYHIIDAMIIENNTITVVELKKNVTNLDSNNVRGKCEYLNDIKNMIGTDWEVKKILVSVESVSHEQLIKKCKLTENYKNTPDLEIMTGVEFMTRLGIDYELFNSLHIEDTMVEDGRAIFRKLADTL